MDSEIIEHKPKYRVPVHYTGLNIPDVVEMTKWREGKDIITTYRDGARFWHFRTSFQPNDKDEGTSKIAAPWNETSGESEPFNPYFSFSNNTK